MGNSRQSFWAVVGVDLGRGVLLHGLELLAQICPAHDPRGNLGIARCPDIFSDENESLMSLPPLC